MVTVKDVAEEISAYLVDQEPGFEFEHWSEDDVLTYVRDAARILVLNFKGEFTATHTFFLQPGTRQTLPSGCIEFVGASAQVDRRGRVLSYLRRASSGTVGALNIAECPVAAGRYRARTYQFDSSDRRTFHVEPAVPYGEQARLEIQCLSMPAIDSFESALGVPEHLIPVLKELVLYYAHGVDQESVTARAYAEMHWKNAAALIGVERATPAVNNIDTIKRE